MEYSDKMQKPTEELRTTFASDEETTFENTDRLPYLAAVLDES
jgi:hypothetical protein